MSLCAEYGLHFRKDGDRWRCVEWPALTMLLGERYEVDGQRFNSLAGAIGRARGDPDEGGATPTPPLGFPKDFPMCQQ